MKPPFLHAGDIFDRRIWSKDPRGLQCVLPTFVGFLLRFERCMSAALAFTVSCMEFSTSHSTMVLGFSPRDISRRQHATFQFNVTSGAPRGQHTSCGWGTVLMGGPSRTHLYAMANDPAAAVVVGRAPLANLDDWEAHVLYRGFQFKRLPPCAQ